MSFSFGADYYPEHWPTERWAKDAELMSELRFNTVRLAEFAWSRIEPTEGNYDFSWLDDALSIPSKRGIKAVIGTPTALPPPWLVRAHPDILQVDGYGRRKAEGTRKNYCAVNPDYLEHTKAIVEKLVLHYKDNPGVVGWQIDNEFDVNLCYCEHSISAFKGRCWAEELETEGAKTVAKYSSGIYAGKPAVVMNSFGRGISFYVGTFASAEFYDALVNWLLKNSIVEEVLPASYGLEVTKREGKDKEALFLLNHRESLTEVDIGSKEFKDLLSGETLRGSIKIGDIDFRVVSPV